MTPGCNDPLVAGAQAVRELTGLSGAVVYLLTMDGRNWFVRKGAARREGNDRLRRQANKQQAWHERTTLPLHTPRILNEGEIAGRYYFDMEAIRGVDGATYLRSADYAAVSRFTARLGEYLSTAAQSSPLPSSSGGAGLFSSLFTRVCEVQSTTAAISADDLAAVFLGLERLRTTGDPGGTLCHGDLTLENLIVDADETIWVLDLLDAPHEHYWFDVAKLHQDLDGGWYRRREQPIARCVTEYVGRTLLATATKLDRRYLDVHAVLMACTFIRILPYAHDAAAQRFVQDRIAYYARSIATGTAVEEPCS